MDIHLSNHDKQELQDVDVSIVYLFGSQAEKIAMSHSDVDLGIVMDDPSILHRQSMSVYQHLFNLFSKLVPNQSLDIVFLQTAPLELRCDAIAHGKIIFEASPTERAEFEQLNLLLCADFKPHQQEIDRTVLQRT